MNFVRKLPDVEEVKEEYSLSDIQKVNRLKFIQDIQEILEGKQKRKIICIGPCSADREDSVIEYVSRLAEVQEKVKDKILLIPRVYTSKPRTKGVGYKGLLHNPIVDKKKDDLWDGVIAVRRMHLRVIQETGMFCADEMLYPEMIYYVLDLLAYVSIGARSVEDQGHRLVASCVELPVGLKNPTNGDLNILLNAISSAQVSQSMIYRGWEVNGPGNPYAHGILRGFNDINGGIHPNYHYEDICKFYDMYQKSNLANMSVIIDCNHCNSAKNYAQQIRIAKDVINTCSSDKNIDAFIKGLMIESYLVDGCQLPGEGVYGKSITDPCLGWDKTNRLLFDLAEMV